jgi:hypothetical protein
MAEQSINIKFVTEEVAAGEALVVELDAEKLIFEFIHSRKIWN